MDKKQYKILKYINDKSRANEKIRIFDVEKIFMKKLNLTKKDINEIVLNLKNKDYIYFRGQEYFLFSTHEGHMIVEKHFLKSIIAFIKTYIYPIIVTAIGCLITYYLKKY